MTTDRTPGVKLGVLWMVILLVFGVTVTGGYVTTAVLTDSETGNMSFDLAGNIGNTGAGNNAAGNAATVTPTDNATANSSGDSSGGSGSGEGQSAVAAPPSNQALAPSAKHGARP
jgi:hypothetical protein